MATLYERIGGSAAVDAAVDVFYRKVLVDDRIAHFFDGVDMDTQAQKQKAFLTMVFGGPNSYSGKDLREGHKHMNLTDEHLDAVIENRLQMRASVAWDVCEISGSAHHPVRC